MSVSRFADPERPGTCTAEGGAGADPGRAAISGHPTGFIGASQQHHLQINSMCPFCPDIAT